MAPVQLATSLAAGDRKRTLDDAKREKMLSELSEIVFNDVALTPMHREVLVVAARNDLQFTTRAEQYTLAANAKT